MNPAEKARELSVTLKREKHRQAMWECYHYSVNRQDRKLTIRNIMCYGFTARQAIDMVQDCEKED